MDTPTPIRNGYEVHQILLGKPAETVMIEPLARPDRVPAEFTLIVFPLNSQGRDGSPIPALTQVGS